MAATSTKIVKTVKTRVPGQPRKSLIDRLSRKTHKPAAVASNQSSKAAPRLSVLAKRKGSRAAAAAAYTKAVQKPASSGSAALSEVAPAAAPLSRGPRTSLGKASSKARDQAARYFLGLIKHLLGSAMSQSGGSLSPQAVSRLMAAVHAPPKAAHRAKAKAAANTTKPGVTSVLDIDGGLSTLNKSAKWRGKWAFSVSALYDLPLQEARWAAAAAAAEAADSDAPEDVAEPTSDPSMPVCPGDLALHREMAAIRQRAWTLLFSSGVDDVASAIATECSTEGWKIREDKPLYVDNGLKDVVTHLLFHYHPAALRVALETVTGHSLQFGPSAVNDGGYSVLRRFIHKSLTFDPELAGEYEHTVKGVWDKQHAARQNARALQRVMTVVLMLDALGTSSTGAALMQSLGIFCVFLPESRIKSTREMLIQISRELLAAEGDVIKHATSIGFMPRYTQSPLQELPYALPRGTRSTEALVEALKDGTRLCRLAELLAGETPLSLVKACIRVPTNSRTTKVRNLKMFLAHINREHGVPLGEGRAAVTADDIVAGKTGSVTNLLWSMLSHWALPVLTPPWKLRGEITAVLRHAPHVGVELLTRPACAGAQAKSVEALLMACREPMDMLLLWSQAVAAGAGVRVRDWSDSWADGRALVAIIRHYSPSALPAELLLPSEEGASLADRKRLQQSRVVQACAAAHGMGFVPLMLPAFDATSPPHPKGMMLYTTYLAARLLDQAKEGRAAMSVQRQWRHHRLLKAAAATAQLAAARTTAARIKLQAWCAKAGALFAAQKQRQALARREGSAVLLQRAFRLKLVARATMQSAAIRGILARGLRARAAWAMRNISANREAVATRISAWWRGRAAVRQLRRAIRAACALQAAARGARVRAATWGTASVSQWRSAALRVQCAWRACLARSQFLAVRRAVVTMQATWRMQLVLAAQHMQLEDTAAVVITWTLRDWCIRSKFLRLRRSAQALQAVVRARRAAKRVAQRTAAAGTIARFASAAALRRHLLKRVSATAQRGDAAVAIQCAVRARSARNTAHGLRMERRDTAALRVQSLWRGVHGRRLAAYLAAQHVAACTICGAVRIAAAVRQLRAARAAATVLTAAARMWRAQSIVSGAATAVVSLQRAARRRAFAAGLARLRAAREHRAAAAITQWWRVQSTGAAEHSAVLLLQRVWRGSVVRRAAAAAAQAASLAALRARITAAAAAAAATPSSTLGARCLRAMKTLHGSDNLSAVLRALLVLQSCTRLSVECCQLAGERDAVTVLFGIVRSCNRSTPHQNVIQAALSTLRNIASRSASRVYVTRCSEAVPVLVDLMQMFRDCLAIHRPATRLLVVLASSSAAVVRRMQGDLALMKRLNAIHTIITRKVTMQARRKAGATGTVGFGAGVVASTIDELQCEDADFRGLQGKQRRGALLLAAAKALGCACHLTADATYAVADIEELLQVLQAPFVVPGGQAAQ